jgi:hypothetical protein
MKKPPDMPKHIRGPFLVYEYSIANQNNMSSEKRDILLYSFLKNMWYNKKRTHYVLFFIWFPLKTWKEIIQICTEV